MLQIFHNQLLRVLNERLAEDSGVFVKVTDGLVSRVLAQADCARFGARELQRVFQRLVTKPVLNLLGQGTGTGELDGVSVMSLL